jgi:hypothetical protein
MMMEKTMNWIEDFVREDDDGWDSVKKDSQVSAQSASVVCGEEGVETE